MVYKTRYSLDTVMAKVCTRRVPWTTHCVLLPHLAMCMDIELWFSRRCIRFLNMAMKLDNVVVRTIINMGIEGFHSVMGRNLRLMQLKFKMDESNVLKFWIHKCDNESDAVRLSVQFRELCGWRDKCNCTFLDKVECKTIIDSLCTDWILTVYFCFKVPYFMCK